MFTYLALLQTYSSLHSIIPILAMLTPVNHVGNLCTTLWSTFSDFVLHVCAESVIGLLSCYSAHIQEDHTSDTHTREIRHTKTTTAAEECNDSFLVMRLN